MSAALTRVRDVFRSLETGDGSELSAHAATTLIRSSRELIPLPVITTTTRIFWRAL
jgi:hypothetical protein